MFGFVISKQQCEYLLYLTLLSGAGILLPSSEASSWYSPHPRVNYAIEVRVLFTNRFCVF